MHFDEANGVPSILQVRNLFSSQIFISVEWKLLVQRSSKVTHFIINHRNSSLILQKW
jgi:hypothetical protein